MIPNFSYPQDKPEQNEEENRKEYEESQIQRQYERNIREARRDVEIAKATGDTEAIAKAEQKVAREQANMRAYLKETGRPRRYDREKIAGTKDIDGYKGFRAQFGSDIPLDNIPKKQYSENMQRMVDGLKAEGVEYKAVKRLEKPLPETEIISKLAGGDLTDGSCVSLALAYAGQLDGLDVIDFRGGNSQNWFASNFGMLSRLNMNIPDINIISEETASPITACNKLIKRVEEGEKYVFIGGHHGAVVTRRNNVLQYLELQSGYDNGWHDFDNNPKFTFATRFDAKSRGGWGKAVMFNVNDVKGSEEFKDLLGYINTAEDKQKKGKNGRER
jgi:hypothetical protein